ncbi:MAG: HAD-IA family hydrolase [Methylococcaceae bacterium]|nr:HAD-IA family hydrolase [Methylococcaceae bacterium]MDD1617717.1 HAD-IA family hydrolase [Methylococcaceae bacterium]OYV15280.1 MAG: phosphoglycolate phosphatase [Methylococcaceae bacterium NSP1-2]
MNTTFKLSCVLFDLDGTLVDTAPDLIACLNATLAAHDLNTVSVAHVKPFISLGALAMINASVTPAVSESKRAELLEAMLTRYENNIAEHTVFFTGMVETLASIEQHGLKWGVVTNKRQRFTKPLMDALQLSHRAACIISGDSTANPKPHSDPMLAACQQAGVNPRECVYIGDASHDITAGKSVEMKTLAAVYGYLKPTDNPETWGADALIDSPEQLTTWINTALCH